MTQSGASQIVNHLEEHLNVKLLDRSKRPFVLTPEGEFFYEGCRKLVQRYYTLEEQVRTLHEEVSGRVTVASIYSVGLSHMNEMVQGFMKSHPKANVRIQYAHPRAVYEMVENDEVDLGLVSYPKSSRTLTATPWRDEPMVFVCSKDHLLAQCDVITVDQLQDLQMVGFDEDLEIRAEIDRALGEQGIEMDVVMEFDNTETIKRAVEINAGVTILPEPTITREVAWGTLVARRIASFPLTRPIGIIHRRGKELGKTTLTFMDLLLNSAPRYATMAAHTAEAITAEPIVVEAPTEEKPGDGKEASLEPAAAQEPPVLQGSA